MSLNKESFCPSCRAWKFCQIKSIIDTNIHSLGKTRAQELALDGKDIQAFRECSYLNVDNAFDVPASPITNSESREGQVKPTLQYKLDRIRSIRKGFPIVSNVEVATDHTPEKLSKSDAFWLGGAFEGGFTFSIHTKHLGKSRSVNSLPLVILNDTDPNKLDAFELELKKYPFGDNWRRNLNRMVIRGGPAALFTLQVRDNCPSRSKILDLFFRWQDGDIQERQEISGVYRRSPQISLLPVSIEKYLDLLDDKDFLAGVIDSAAWYYAYKYNGQDKYELGINTKNENLTRALCVKFQAKVPDFVPGKSNPFRIFGKRAERVIFDLENSLRYIKPKI